MPAGFKFLVLFFCALPAWANPGLGKPLIEAGVAGGAGYLPDYPAAGEGRLRAMAFPVFNLRGKVLRSDDEDGSRARLLNQTYYSLDLSASGSFPASSDQNEARAGMQDLAWLGELGPRVFVIFMNDGKTSLRASMSVRGAFSTDFTRGDYRGLTFTPGLALDRKNLGSRYISLTLRLSPQWASRELHSYFYSVPEKDARPGRPAYGANAGYMGTSLFSAFFYERGSYGLFAGGGFNFHDGAANEHSPLFRERLTYAGFIGFRWYFYKSDAIGYE